MNNIPYRIAQKHPLGTTTKDSFLNQNATHANITQYQESFGAAGHAHATPVVTQSKFLSQGNQYEQRNLAM